MEMTGLAFGEVVMFEGSQFPIGGVAMAHGAFTRKVDGWHIFQMAGLAFRYADMVKLVRFPIVNEVTVGAFTGEVINGGLVAAAALTGCAFVLPKLVTGGAFDVVPASEGEEAVVNLP